MGYPLDRGKINARDYEMRKRTGSVLQREARFFFFFFLCANEPLQLTCQLKLRKIRRRRKLR